jgi:hypothetical protein
LSVSFTLRMKRYPGAPVNPMVANTWHLIC